MRERFLVLLERYILLREKDVSLSVREESLCERNRCVSLCDRGLNIFSARDRSLFLWERNL